MPKMQRGSQEPGRVGGDGRHASTVLIVSAIRFVREGLAQALGGNSLLKVSGLSANLDEALISARELKPAVILLDANFPDGANAIRLIRAADPEPRIVVFAVAETEENIITWAESRRGRLHTDHCRTRRSVSAPRGYPARQADLLRPRGGWTYTQARMRRETGGRVARPAVTVCTYGARAGDHPIGQFRIEQ
jgi:CheY-like chemotaxis protein